MNFIEQSIMIQTADRDLQEKDAIVGEGSGLAYYKYENEYERKNSYIISMIAGKQIADTDHFTTIFTVGQELNEQAVQYVINNITKHIDFTKNEETVKAQILKKYKTSIRFQKKLRSLFNHFIEVIQPKQQPKIG